MEGNFRNQNLEDSKKKILGFIQSRGPSLPIHISNYLRLDTLLSGAFLSDLLSDNELKISNLRVGNSPVYFVKGQEEQLEKFSVHLGSKEKEAYNLLKEHGVLNDKLLLPPIRVALRNIKDFSFSLKHNEELYWRYITIDERKAIEMVDSGQANFNQLPPGYQRVVPAVVPTNIVPVSVPKQELVVDTPKNDQLISASDSKDIEVNNSNEKQIEPIFSLKQEEKVSLKSDIPKQIAKPKKVKLKEKSEFILKVEEFLEKNNLKIVNEIDVKKKDYSALISVPNPSVDGGSTDYLCIAKEKKAVSDLDLMKYLQLGQKEKLPVLFLSNGEANKKAVDWLDYLGNVIIYKKLD